MHTCQPGTNRSTKSTIVRNRRADLAQTLEQKAVASYNQSLTFQIPSTAHRLDPILGHSMKRSKNIEETGEATPRKDQTQLFHLDNSFNDVALSNALKRLCPSGSWGQVKKWILGRYVDVNGNLCLDVARRVKEGDVVRLWDNPRPRPVHTEDIRLVHLDEHLLVVEKPSGINSVRHFEERSLSTRRRQLQPTLDELLPPVLAKIQRLRWPPLPPKGMNKGARRSKPAYTANQLPIQNPHKIPPELQVFPVHRLDRNTSGLMLFARTRAAEQRLIAMFRRHTVQREYVAVCHGAVQPQTIESLLVRDRGDGLRGSLPNSATEQQREVAERAVTHILGAKTIAGGAYSLVRCRLETGRTHQIRIHLSEAGHRICGEPLYIIDSATGLPMQDTSGAPRQALHSDRLAFSHPFTGQQLKFEMPWPKDLAGWVRSLGQS